mmetsp:Transcript_10852/g.23980  ORF Transcript_10852/g.23980 Transcript_10852/m.23980 type:complete len:664 (+) Transcript_10852:70-2061(+)
MDIANNEASSLNLDGGRGGSDSDSSGDDDASLQLRLAIPQNNGGGYSSAAAEATHHVQFRKSSLRSRWLVLGLTCIVMTGSYYAYDIPSALHQQLQDYMPPSSNYETNFNLLYTVYSIPNVILPLFGGNVVDRHGAPLCLAIFAAAVFMGAVLLSIGVANKSWEMMYIGRFVFGLGAESLCVAQSTIVSDWFEGREVAFAMGIGLAVSRLGSIWNNVVSPKVANSSGGGIESAFWIGALLTSCSVVMAGMIVLVDKRATRKLKRRGGQALPSLTVALLENEVVELRGDDGIVSREGDEGYNPANGGEVFDENNEPSTKPCIATVESGVHITDIRTFGPLFWLLTISCFVVYGCVLPFNNVASGILLERNYFTSAPESCKLEYPNQCTVGYLVESSNSALEANGDVCLIAPSQAPVLPSSVNHTSLDSGKSSEWDDSSYVYSPLTSTNVDCGDSFWLDACTSDYCTKQHEATEHAGKVMSIPYLISAMSSPPLDHLVDRYGRRAQIAVVSSSLLFMVHLTLALSSSSPIGPMLGQGIAYSLYAAVLWPSVPLTVPKQYTGTAFGVITSIQNIGLALFPLLIAAIYDGSGGRYIPNVEFFFMSCAAAGVVVGIFMNRVDRRYGDKLNGATGTEDEEEVIDSLREDGVRDFDDVDDDYFSPLHHSG